MGALSDITAIATNRKSRSTYSKAPEALDTPASVKVSSTNPRFMSPTIASSQQGTTPSAHKRDRTFTPTSISSSKAKSNSWMASAAKRVGISRMSDGTSRTSDGTPRRSDGTPRRSDGTPRAKKESSLKKSKDLISPDKLGTRSYMQLPGTPPKNYVASRVLPSEKPLPSPPLAQVVTGSPTKESRCLIDASEKPLRRSPPGKPHQEEEWPVLFPEKPTSPATLRDLHGQDSRKLTLSPANIELNPTEKFSSVQSIQRKPSSTKESVIDPSVSLKKQNSHVRVSSTACDDSNASATAATSLLMSDPELPSDLSASASALEKSAQESKKFPEPHPTRTSSLRARISTGNLTTNAKVVGFTDFTTIKEGSGITEQGTLRITSDSSTRAKTSSHSAVPGKKPSTSPARVNRAPTKFITTSRRPAVLHQPSSRGNLRGDAHDRNTADGTSPPSRNAPNIPTSKICDAEIAKESKEQLESATPEQRRSSIPLFRGAVRSIADHGGDESEIVKCGPKPAADLSNAPSKQKQRQETLSRVKKSEESPILECVGESPRASYQIKRLSVTSPEHGPTLRISSSAERLIMGKDTDKEIQADLKKKQSKDLRRTVITKELRKTATDIELNSQSRMHHERPHTSGSLRQSRSRIYIMDDEVEQKEGESAAIRHALPTNNLDLEFAGRKPTEPLRNEDPFFDARSQISHNGSAIIETYPTTSASGGVGASVETPMDVQHIIPMEEASWISPMPKKISGTRLSDATPVNPAFLPTSMLEHVRNSAQTESLDGLTHMTPKELLSAPEHHDQDHPSTSPGDFPPRSSSRVQAPDYTVTALANNSCPALPTDTGKRLSDDFRTRQNKLGKKSGCGSEQLDLTDMNAKRDSAARESNKSQGAYSRGVFSNIRGLFHKRSLDASGLKPSVKATKTGKGRISINSNGSPFPPMSQVHSIHRPTLTSTPKSRAAMAIDKKSPLRSHGSPKSNNTTSDATPAFESPVPTEMCTTTALAMRIINSASLETSSPRRETLFELSQALVDMLARAREAEKAMLEAKHAARMAELSHVRCQRSVSDVVECVERWERNSGGGGL